MPISRAKSALANAALLAASLVIGYLALEIAFFRLVLPNIVGEFRPHLSETAEVLVQNSKRGTAPRDYVAILGDSYAEGIGDWLTAVGRNESLPFHSAHVVHELTGKDVVSFGKGGASSAEGMVRQPARVMAGSRCIIFPEFEAPSRLVVYFYEGNDLQENLAFLRHVRARHGGEDTAAIDRFLAEDYGRFASWRCHLYFFDTFGRIVRYLYRLHVGDGAAAPQPPPMGGNRFILAQSEIDAASGLQGPALELDDARLAKGLEVFDRSLAWLAQSFKGRQISVVYIPSPLAIYRLGGETVTHIVEPMVAQVLAVAPVERVARHSDRICAAIRAAALRHAVGFHNTRAPLRKAAETTLLHGPLDWNHFNETGYRLLGALIAKRLDNVARVDEC